MNKIALVFTTILSCTCAHAEDDWEEYRRIQQLSLSVLASISPSASKAATPLELIEMYEGLLRQYLALNGDGTKFRKEVNSTIKIYRNQLAPLYTKTGQFTKALSILLPQYEEYVKERGLDGYEASTLVRNIAQSYYSNAEYEQSLAYAKIGVIEVERMAGFLNTYKLVVAVYKSHMHDLAAKSLLFLGRIEEADAAFAEGKRLFESSNPKSEWGVRLGNVASAYQLAGKFARAEETYQLAIAMLKQHTHDGSIFITQNNLGGLYMQTGQYAKSRDLMKQLIADAEKALGKDYGGYGTHLRNLTNAEMALGQYGSALHQLQRALAVNEARYGQDSLRTAPVLQALASLHTSLGDYATAQALLERVLKNQLRQLGETGQAVYQTYQYLAELYSSADHHDKAREMAQRALQISEKHWGKNNPRYGDVVARLALIEANAGNPELALAHATESLTVSQKAHGEQSFAVALDKIRLAGIHVRGGQHAQATPLLQQALAVMEDPAYETIITIPVGWSLKARNALALGERDAALRSVRRMMDGLRQHTGKSDAEAKINRQLVRKLLFSGLRVMHEAGTPSSALPPDSFEAAQLARASEAADALTQMTVRFAAGESDIAVLIRARQDAHARYQALVKDLTTKLSSVPPAAPKVLEDMRANTEQARQELARQDAQISQRFPQYNQLIEGRPQQLAAVRAALEPGEAMISFLMDPDLRPRFDLPATAAPMTQVYAWVIRRDGGAWIKLDTSQKELEQLVQEVRKSTDLTGPSVKPFATQASHTLYLKLLAPLKSQLAGIQRLVIVPDGPLTSLPFPALLTAPATVPAQMAGYRKLPWLAESYGLNILPNEGSLVALRSNLRVADAPQAMAGFGDPLFQGTDSTKRGIKSTPLYNIEAAARGAIASIDSVRLLARLPETADELRQIAKTLGTGEQSLFLQQRASEEMVKTTDLTPYRVISFATHGLMAGEFSGVSEPGLALTPPASPENSNEGFLAASEAAQLKLNADWVVLSACNTAAPDGKPGASGLSGLSSAFLYAGARSVLVSHWAVDSDATVTLMSKLFANRAKGMSKAESHRKAMLSVKNESKNLDYAHPAFWAPFVVVGEGK